MTEQGAHPLTSTASDLTAALDSAGVYTKAPHSQTRWTVYHDPRERGVKPTVLGHVTKVAAGYVATTAKDLMEAVDSGATRLNIPEVACRSRRIDAVWDLVAAVDPELAALAQAALDYR